MGMYEMKIKNILLFAGLAFSFGCHAVVPPGAATALDAPPIQVTGGVADILTKLGRPINSAVLEETIENALQQDGFTTADAWVPGYQNFVENLIAQAGDVDASALSGYLTNIGNSLPKGENTYAERIFQLDNFLQTGGDGSIGKLILPTDSDGAFYASKLDYLVRNNITTTEQIQQLNASAAQNQDVLPIAYDPNAQAAINTGSGTSAYASAYNAAYAQLGDVQASDLKYLYDAQQTLANSNFSRLETIIRSAEGRAFTEEEQAEIESLADQITQANAESAAAAQRYNETDPADPIPENDFSVPAG